MASIITELRKAGKLDEALKLALQELQSKPDDIWKKREIAWVYYDFLKEFAAKEDYRKFCEYLREIFRLKLPTGDIIFNNLPYVIFSFLNTLGKSEVVDYRVVDWVLEKCKILELKKPSLEYSILLKAFHKAYKSNRQKYIEMVEWWDLNNLMPEDYQNVNYNNTNIQSIAEKVYCCYAKYLLPTTNMRGNVIFNREKAIRFLPVLAQIAEKYPNYQYISYYQAKLLLSLGDQENIISAFLPFALKKKNDFWIWDLIGDSFEDDKDKMFACYCKGLSCPADEKMTTKLRGKIIPLLLEKELYNEAKTEVDKIIAIKQVNNYKIPDNILNYQNTEWYKNATAQNNNIRLYKKYTPIAEEILFSEFLEEEVLVENINEEKKILNIITEEGEKIFFKYDKILKKQTPMIGDTYKIRFSEKSSEKPSKVVTILKTNNEKLKNQYTKDFSGNISINKNKDFGFVEDIFISPKFCKEYSLVNGNFVQGKAVQTFNKNKKSWKAFIILKA